MIEGQLRTEPATGVDRDPELLLSCGEYRLHLRITFEALHCSVVSFYFAGSNPPKSDADARASFIASAWYNKRIGNKADLSAAALVLQKSERRPRRSEANRSRLPPTGLARSWFRTFCA
jgi:hypothetical protein